jgi:uncharacterized membrane protein (UPF0127 family)
MKTVYIQNLTKPLKLPLKARFYDDFISRGIGLMFHPLLDISDGIVLVGKSESRLESSIHMFFMRINLTVIWLNKQYVVVDVKLAKRWHPIYLPIQPAQYVLEVSESRLKEFSVGDQLQFNFGD